MPFQPQALDERTLKAFVDRLMESLRDKTSPTLKRSAAQETVARMLGFANWHTAITAVTSERSKPQANAIQPTAIGLYPAEPSRFTPDHAQAFLLWAFEMGASDVYFITGGPILLEASGRSFAVTRRKITAEEEQAFSQACGANANALQVDLQKNSQAQDWATTLRGADNAFRLRVSRFPIFENGKPQTRLTLRFIPMTPPDLHTVVQDKKLAERMTQFQQGMVLLASETSQGRTTLLASLTKELARQPGKKIVAFQDPIEFDFSTFSLNEGTQIQQHEVTHDSDWPHLTFGRALKRRPSTIVVGDAWDLEAAQEAVTAAMTGHLVAMDQRSGSVPDAITRTLRGYHQHEWKSRANDLLCSLRLVVVQRIVPTLTGTQIGIQEWLLMTNEALDACLVQLDKATTALQLRALLEEVLDQHGHTFESSAQSLLKQGIVSQKTVDDQAMFHKERRQEKWRKD